MPLGAPDDSVRDGDKRKAHHGGQAAASDRPPRTSRSIPSTTRPGVTPLRSSRARGATIRCLRHPGLPITSVFRYADVHAILRDADTWSSRFPPPPGIDPALLPEPSMLGQDPPQHTRLRGLVSQAFTPRIIRRLAPRIEVIAHELHRSRPASRHGRFRRVVHLPVAGDRHRRDHRHSPRRSRTVQGVVRCRGRQPGDRPLRPADTRTVERAGRAHDRDGSILRRARRRAPPGAARRPAHRTRASRGGGIEAHPRRDDPHAGAAAGGGKRNHDDVHRQQRARAAGASRRARALARRARPDGVRGGGSPALLVTGAARPALRQAAGRAARPGDRAGSDRRLLDRLRQS